MADSVEAYLRSLEKEYERPPAVRNLMPRPSGGLTVSVARAAGQAGLVNAGPINFTVTFSKPVTGFANNDISFTGSTVGGTPAAAVTGGPSVYNVAVTGMTGSGLVAVNVLPGAATDAAGTLSPGAVAAFVMFDTTAPSVTINKAATQDDPSNMMRVFFTVVFSETVLGFTASDVNLAASTVTGTLTPTVFGSGPTYTVQVMGMAGAGDIVASIPAAVVTDMAGNANTPSTSTDNVVAWVPDFVVPAVTINKAAGQADPTNVGPILFDVVFSEIVTGFLANEVSFAGSTTGGGGLLATMTGSGATYSISVTGMTTPGNVVVSVPAGVAMDMQGNLNTASTSTDNTVAYDAGTPGVFSLLLEGAGGDFLLLENGIDRLALE